MTVNEWRIDELGNRAGLSVDTIRYYAREGLLPPPERSGRNAHYGPRHLERLEWIAALRSRRFSIAAIREVVGAGSTGPADLGGRPTYTLDDLSARSGIDLPLVEQLQQAGLLPDRPTRDSSAYDADDLEVLEAIGELVEIGTPAEVLIELVRIYADHFERLRRAVLEMLAGSGENPPNPAAVATARVRFNSEPDRVAAAADRLLGYMHRRTMQRLAGNPGSD